jgi:hypothetical protein
MAVNNVYISLPINHLHDSWLLVAHYRNCSVVLICDEILPCGRARSWTGEYHTLVFNVSASHYRRISENLARQGVCQTRLINQKTSPEGAFMPDQSVRRVFPENHNDFLQFVLKLVYFFKWSINVGPLSSFWQNLISVVKKSKISVKRRKCTDRNRQE